MQPTPSMETPRSDEPALKDTGSPAGLRAASNANTEPSPMTLDSRHSPFMARTRRSQIVRPSPVPPCFRVVDESTWEKASNSEGSLSSGMPHPVSVTLKRTLPGPARPGSMAISTPPVSVNLIALLARLLSTWRSLVGSAFTGGIRGSTKTARSRPFCVARSAKRLATSSAISARSTSTASSSSLPASTLEKSRMSLMMPRRDFPDLAMTLA